MVSEGVDIPRLRVGVYATAAKTPLIFRQIVGRFVRTIPGRGLDMSWLYLPADPVLRAHAADVENDLSPILRRLGLVDDELLDEVPDRARDRALRGAGVRAARRRPVADAAARAVRGSRAARPAPMPRVRVRRRGPARRSRRSRPSSAARSCATSATASSRTCAAPTAAPTPRSTPGSIAPTGIRRVEDASIDQLERSIALLIDALSRSR